LPGTGLSISWIIPTLLAAAMISCLALLGMLCYGLAKKVSTRRRRRERAKSEWISGKMCATTWTSYVSCGWNKLLHLFIYYDAATKCIMIFMLLCYEAKDCDHFHGAKLKDSHEDVFVFRDQARNTTLSLCFSSCSLGYLIKWIKCFVRNPKNLLKAETKITLSSSLINKCRGEQVPNTLLFCV